jgi:hypothetical protein
MQDGGIETMSEEISNYVSKYDCGRNRDSSVGIVTVYWMDGWGSIFKRSRISLFSLASIPDLGPTQPPNGWVPGGFFSWGKTAGV